MRRLQGSQDAPGSSFLEKFSGRATRIGKQGISGIINTPSSDPLPQNKRPSVYRLEKTREFSDYSQHNVNLDELLPDPSPGHLSSSKVIKRPSQKTELQSVAEIKLQNSRVDLEQLRTSTYSVKSDVERGRLGGMAGLNSLSGLRSTRERPGGMFDCLLSEDALGHLDLLNTIERRFKGRG